MLNNFNTSHVSINPSEWATGKESNANFNTSHVSINQNNGRNAYLVYKFQYISCFY